MSRPALDRWRPSPVAMGGVQRGDYEHLKAI